MSNPFRPNWPAGFSHIPWISFQGGGQVAIGRKNYLFYGSLSGGRTAATLYSVVQSARLHQIDVTAYLTDVLRRLPALAPDDEDRIGELLPDRWAKTHPENVLIPRIEESRQAVERRRQRRAARRLLTNA
jgi:transposase